MKRIIASLLASTVLLAPVGVPVVSTALATPAQAKLIKKQRKVIKNQRVVIKNLRIKNDRLRVEVRLLRETQATIFEAVGSLLGDLGITPTPGIGGILEGESIDEGPYVVGPDDELVEECDPAYCEEAEIVEES